MTTKEQRELDAFEVLEQIANKGAKPVLYKGINESGLYKFCLYDEGRNLYAEAETLDEAVRKFARQLFSKEGR